MASSIWARWGFVHLIVNSFDRWVYVSLSEMSSVISSSFLRLSASFWWPAPPSDFSFFVPGHSMAFSLGSCSCYDLFFKDVLVFVSPASWWYSSIKRSSLFCSLEGPPYRFLRTVFTSSLSIWMPHVWAAIVPMVACESRWNWSGNWSSIMSIMTFTPGWPWSRWIIDGRHRNVTHLSSSKAMGLCSEVWSEHRWDRASCFDPIGDIREWKTDRSDYKFLLRYAAPGRRLKCRHKHWSRTRRRNKPSALQLLHRRHGERPE